MAIIFQSYGGSIQLGESVIRDHLPKGRAWNFLSRFGSAIIGSMAACWGYCKDYIDYLKTQSKIDTTTDAIDLWEESVMLPDACSLYSSTIEQRRGQVMLRLKNEPFVTTKEIEEAIRILTGYEIIVKPRRDEENLANNELDSAVLDAAILAGYGDLFTFDVFINYDDTESMDKLPLNTPFDGKPRPSVIECVINKIKPSNSVAQYYYSSSKYEEQKRIL